MAVKTVKINGVDFEIEDAAQEVDTTEAPLFKKGDREALSPEKLNELFERIARGCKQKYQLPSMSLQGTEQLEEVYDLENTIRTTRQHYCKYDMESIFTIILHDGTDLTVVKNTKSLFTDYVDLTEEQVAKSNAWYRKMPKGDKARKHFAQDLKVTAEHLEQAIDDSLLSKCFETYLSYSVEEQGGPLLFKIMIDKVQSTTATAVDYILKTISTMKISEIQGENVGQAVSLIRGGISRVKLYKDPVTKAGALPHDLNSTLCKTVLQSTTCDEFNAVFKQIHQTSEISRLSGLTPNVPTTEQLLKIAESHYRDLSMTNDWTGVDKTGTSMFHAGPVTRHWLTRHCFNCGATDHESKDCPKPSNPDAIKRNKKDFLEKVRSGRGGGRGGRDSGRGRGGRGRGGRGGRGKNTDWSPPTEAEKANNSRRTINGKLMYYHFKSRRWNPVKSEANAATGDTPAWANKIVEDVNAALSTATANPQAGVPGTTPTAQVADTATGNSDTAKTAQLRLLAANVERTISQALSQASANS